jgi:hypothetical protein
MNLHLTRVSQDLMKKVFTAHDTILAGYFKSILEERGIACVLRNDYLGGGAGELPLNECWPEIWVVDPREEQLAKSIIAQNRTPAEGDAWLCPSCQESLEPQFTSCWQCGTTKPL